MKCFGCEVSFLFLVLSIFSFQFCIIRYYIVHVYLGVDVGPTASTQAAECNARQTPVGTVLIKTIHAPSVLLTYHTTLKEYV